MKIISVLLFFVFAGFIYTVTDQYPHGIVGLTRLNGEGCVCHNLEPNQNVMVTIKGPDSLAQGSSAEYTITVRGGSQVDGGFNVAARFGLLSVSDISAKKIDVELTHTSPKPFTGDSVKWSFMYTAPAGVASDTLYSVGLSADGNGTPSVGDVWNFGNNFPVRILAAVPVELTSFTAESGQEGVLLQWVTSSESNNKGFSIERKPVEGTRWEVIGFVSGAGSTAEQQNYNYLDKSAGNGDISYRLKQTDYNGTYRYYGAVNVTGIGAPKEFLMVSAYPNPFNPDTRFEFTLAGNGILSIDIFSASGELVESLGSMQVNSGIYSTNWRAVNKGAGIYYARAQFVSGLGKVESSIVKLVLLK